MTEKRKVSAKEILADIRAGVDDEGLMEKYQLSPQELQVVFGKMISGGVFTTDDLVRRATGGEKKAARSELSQQTKEPGWQCPICRKSQKEPFEKCPECGAVLVEKVPKETTYLRDLPPDSSEKAKDNGKKETTEAEKCPICEKVADKGYQKCPGCGRAIPNFVLVDEEAESIPYSTRTTDDLVRRATGGEKSHPEPKPTQQREEPGWRCPACHKSQTQPFEKCPECGAVVVERVPKETPPSRDVPADASGNAADGGKAETKEPEKCPICDNPAIRSWHQTCPRCGKPTRENNRCSVCGRFPEFPGTIGVNGKRYCMNCLPRYQGHSIRMHSGGWFKAKLAKIKDIGNTVKQKTRVGGVLVLIIAVMLAVVAIFLMLKRQSDLPDGLEKEILAHYGIGDTFSYAGDIWASTELPVGSCLLYTRFVPVKVISARSVSGKESGIYEEYLRPDGRTGLELPLRAYQIEIRYNRKCLYSRIIWRVNKEKCVLPVNHLIW